MTSPSNEVDLGASEKPQPGEQPVDRQVANLLELAKSTHTSDNFYVHIIWLIEGLEVWHRSGGKRGHSPDDCKRYVISSILNHKQGSDLPTEDSKPSAGHSEAQS